MPVSPSTNAATGRAAAGVRLAARWWLSEVRADDTALAETVPALAEAVPDWSARTLTDLAVAYQDLTGAGIPPYESVFVDPSAMLFAPATARVEALYRGAGWSLPPGTRVGAPDHLGAELSALATWLDDGLDVFARHIVADHLALWVPAWHEALSGTPAHPFYRALADLTLEIVLSSLPADPLPPGADPFPPLPPPPRYRGSDDGDDGDAGSEDSDVGGPSLGAIVRCLLTPRDAGFYVTRHDIAALAQSADVAIPAGDRSFALASLFRAAGAYDALPALWDGLAARCDRATGTYRALAADHPAWGAYAAAWEARVEATRGAVEEWRGEGAGVSDSMA